MSLNNKTAAELSLMLKNKEISAVELTKDVFSQIANVEDKIGAYVTLCEESAVAAAQKVDEKRANGEQLSELAGIPIAVKDNLCTDGILTTCSSKMLYNFVPPYNATVVDKIYKNDMIVTGKTNMDEFAMGSSCENSYFKKTTNPFDISRVPGGSSGGSAAAVAAGEAILSLGSDTGGSIRQPAGFCGIVGLKPTYGAVSRYGLVAFASSLDQVGPFAKTCEDTAMLFNAIAGRDKMDATSTDFALKASYTDLLSRDVKGMRIGIPAEYYGEGIDAEVAEAVENAAKVFESLGAEIVPLSAPLSSGALAAYYIIACAEASSNLARFDGVKYGYRSPNYSNLNEMYLNTRSEGFGAEVKRRIILGTYLLSSGNYDIYYKRAKDFQRSLSMEFAENFKKVDFILTPTGPTTAFKFGENSDDPVKMYKSDICTVTVNIAGLPGLSMPCGFDSNGMPIGMQLIGPKFSEDVLLSAGHAYEKATGYSFNVPKI